MFEYFTYLVKSDIMAYDTAVPKNNTNAVIVSIDNVGDVLIVRKSYSS